MANGLNDLLLLAGSTLAAACKARGIDPGPTKQSAASALHAAGVNAAAARQAAGIVAASVDPVAVEVLRQAAENAARLAAAAQAEAQQAAQAISRVAVAAAAKTDLSAVAEAAAAAAASAAAAGAVAARAEAAALAARPAKVDPAAIRTAIAEAVAKHVQPLAEVLAQASPEVQAEALAAVAAPVRRDTVLAVFGIDLRDRKGNPVEVEIWADPLAPAIDPLYIWTPDLLAHLVQCEAEGENLWLAGPKGTGKTQACMQFAARTGRSFTRVNFQKYTCAEDFIGSTGIVNGSTVFKPADFLIGYTRPGAVILLDEVSNGDPGNLAVLNGYLEPGARVNAGGSVWSRANGVLVFAADNSTGCGDDSGRYAGLREMNSSFLDRFARTVQLEYLPADRESEALALHTRCSSKLARHVVDCINAARAKVKTGDIVDAPSLRQAIAFVRALRLHSVDEAWRSAIASKQPAESALALDAIRAACLNTQLIEGEL